MAKTRAQKQTEVQEFVDGFRAAKSVIFADMAALKVNDASALRRTAKKEDVAVSTAKKTLLRRALKDAGIAAIDVEQLKGSVSMLFGMADAVAPAKVLEQFRKDHDNVKVLGGYFESQWMSIDQVKALAKLPSKQELIGQVVGTIAAPLSGFVNVLQGNIRNLVYALGAIKDSKTA